jgi:hypothetical protein
VVEKQKKSLSFAGKALMANPVDCDTRDGMHPVGCRKGFIAPVFY